MKKVIVHWVEMRTLEVPDECPTDDQSNFEKWLYDRADSDADPYLMKYGNTFVTDMDTRDFEIVDVEAIVPENEKVGGGDDIHQR